VDDQCEPQQKAVGKDEMPPGLTLKGLWDMLQETKQELASAKSKMVGRARVARGSRAWMNDTRLQGLEDDDDRIPDLYVRLRTRIHTPTLIFLRAHTSQAPEHGLHPGRR
jgi:hypothetical protein